MDQDTIVLQKLSTSPSFRIWLCGPFRIERYTEGAYQPIRTAEWGGSSYPRLLLKALLCCPGRQARRESLLELLWPENDPEQSVNYLNTATTKLRKVLHLAGERQSLLITENDASLYCLADQSLLWVDADEALAFLKEVEQQGRTLPEALPGLERAGAYFGVGLFLQEEEGQWVTGRRATIAQARYRSQLWLAEAYEQQGMPGQAETVLSALLEEDRLDEDVLCRLMRLLYRQGMTHQALRLYERMRTIFTREQVVFTEGTRTIVSQLRERNYSFPISFDSPLEGGSTPLFQREASVSETLIVPSSQIADDFARLWPDDLLTIYSRGIAACQDLYFSGNPYQVEAILPLYSNQVALIVSQTSSIVQKSAARLASQASHLACELAIDHEDFWQAQKAGRQAFSYAQLANDANLQVAALISLANLAFHRKLSTTALRTYKHAVSLLNEHVTPLLKGRTYAGIAEVYAMRGQLQETMRAMGLAYDHYPLKPEIDPAYPYLRASRYSLYVFGDAQSRLFLNQPKEADKALIAMQKETNDPLIEPITKLDLLYYQAEVQVQQRELEPSSAILTEAAILAKDLGSRLYFNKLVTSYHTLYKYWPREAAVVPLKDVFQPW